MSQSDDPLGPRLARTEKHEQELNRLGRTWFAEAREQSARDEAEFETWRRDQTKKWARFNHRSLYADFPDDSRHDGGGSRSD